MAQRTWTRATLLKRFATAVVEELDLSCTGDELLADPETYLENQTALDLIEILRGAVIREALR